MLAGKTVFNQGDKWLGVKEAAELLGISSATIRRFTNSGKLKAYRLPNGYRRILESDLLQLLEEWGR